MKKIIVILIAQLTLSIVSFNTQAQVAVSVGIAPPELPVYTQPACPVDGYIWEPGYWDYGTFGYYWVPGVWVAPPRPGFLWTPCWWGFAGGRYVFHAGYWGPTVGFYGGINYGFGYFGAGYDGGRWVGGRFQYNTAISRVNGAVIHNVYVDRAPLAHANVVSHVSFNGPHGYTRQASPAELQAARSPGVMRATQEQELHRKNVGADKGSYFSNNHGHPGNAAMDRVGGHAFDEKGAGRR